MATKYQHYWRRVFYALPLLLLVIIPSSANADWQYTRWGMSINEVKLASGGKAYSHDGKKSGKHTKHSVALLEAEYSARRFEFRAFFYFDRQTRKLSKVSLELTDHDKCSDLVGALRRRYGGTLAALETESERSYSWRDPEAANFVGYVGIGPFLLDLIPYGGCWLSYSQLETAESGL